MPGGAIDELHAAMYAPLITHPSCDECRLGVCHRPHWITNQGQLREVVGDTPGCAVRWDKCPRTYQCLRKIGQEDRPIDDIVAWGIECDWHKDPMLGGGAAAIYREYALRRGHLDQLLMARERAKAK